MPKSAIVLGMARSGTSLTASIFVRKGYFGGESFPEPDRLNPVGYFEAQELVQRNSDLIRSSGFPHDNSWVYTPMTAAQLESLRHVRLGDTDRQFIARFEQRRPWVWKDPRLCLLLRAWWPLLDPQGAAVLLIERDRDAIFESFVRAGWRPPGRASRLAVYELIKTHIETAEETIADLSIPALRIRYEDFHTDPGGTAARIGAQFDLPMTKEDILYDAQFNHDNAKGRFSTRIDRLATMMPAPLRGAMKRMTPSRLLRVLYPERYQ